jgi:UV DNA damage endonuclease
MGIRCGFACINTLLREQGITVNRGVILKTIGEKGFDYVKELVKKNLEDLEKLILWNEEHGIHFMRLSSDMVPHATSELVKNMPSDYPLEFIRKDLARIGKLARNLGHRLTFHPGPYNQLGTPTEKVLDSTIRDLNFHANLLLAMGLTPALGSVLIVHGGGHYGDKEETLKRWREGFAKLPPTTQQFIVLENDERSYSPLDLLPVCEELGVPLCLDFFHYKCMYGDKEYEKLLEDKDLLSRIFNTWTKRGIKPKVHVSSQREGARMGNHDDYIDTKDIKMSKILKICQDWDVDIMLECKFKEACALRVLEEFFVKEYTDKDKFYWKPKDRF